MADLDLAALPQRATIAALAPRLWRDERVRAVEQTEGATALAICGLPTRDRAEICAAIERHREVAARIGRTLAARYGFDYPTDLEEMVVRAWDDFKSLAVQR